MVYISVLLLLLAAAWFLLGYRISGIALHPPRRAVTRSPDDYGLAYENVTFASNDGLQLKGWWVSAAPERADDRSSAVPVVILLHPMFGNRQGSFTDPLVRKDRRHGGGLDMLELACSFHTGGYAVLLFDFRNHGESQSGLSAGGYSEDQDVVGAVDYAFRRMAAEASDQAPQVGAVGIGLGASAAITAIGREPGDGRTIRVFSADNEGATGLMEFQPANVKRLRFLVAIEPATLRTVLRGYFRRTPPLLAWLMDPIVDKFCQWQGGYPLGNALLIQYARQVYTPALYVQVHRDRRNGDDEVQRLYEATPGPKQMWWAGDRPGKDSVHEASDDLVKQVMAFAAENAGPQQPRRS